MARRTPPRLYFARHINARWAEAPALQTTMTEQALNDQDPQQAETPSADTQADPLDELRREKDSRQHRLLRTAAEFDNYRKRVDRERRELADYMKADVLAELLPILDNF